MATTILNYNGTTLTVVQDGTIDTTHASIAFPGRGYLNYGAAVNQDMLWIMQNFAAATSPANPVTGQAWYNTTLQLLEVYTGSAWVPVGGVISQAYPGPASGVSVGAFWYDTTNNQLNVWSGSAWLLVGPLGSSANTDPINPALPAYSKIVAVRFSDGVSNHNAWEVIIGGVLLAIISSDATYTPSPAITGFGPTVLNPGINLNTTISNVTVSGDSTTFKSTQNNLPSVNNTWNMGSVSHQFANMYATNFVGTATSALYADVAEYYIADRNYPPGTVVAMAGPNEITVASSTGTTDVFGVISTNPAFIMNREMADKENALLVGLTGRVPCKVVGPVRQGQRLMASSLEGAACAWDPSYSTLSIVGRIIKDKLSTGIDTVEIFVGKN